MMQARAQDKMAMMVRPTWWMSCAVLLQAVAAVRFCLYCIDKTWMPN